MKKTQTTILLDERNTEDIRQQFKKLAASYTPEWHMDEENPDIGGVIACLNSAQTAENVERINQTLWRYQLKFVNLLDLSLKGPRPAESILLMQTLQDTVTGVPVPKGTRFLAGVGENEEDIVFETVNDAYITGVSLSRIFQGFADDEGIGAVLGDYELPGLLNPVGAQELEEAPEESGEELPARNVVRRIEPFRLFDDRDALRRNALAIYHSCLFEDRNQSIYVRISGAEQIRQMLSDGQLRFMYPSEDGFTQIESCRILNRDDAQGELLLELVRSGKEQRQLVDERECSLLLLESSVPITEDVAIRELSFSAAGSEESPIYVGDGSRDFDISVFEPFGQTLGLYQECYISLDPYFRKEQSLVTITFGLTFETHLESMTAQQVNEQLKIIKRRPRSVQERPADVYADRIVLEYYNGIGWKKLSCREETAAMFAQGEGAQVTISFICPSDWEESESGSCRGRMLRMQILQADNCYMRPAIHHYPVIRDMKLSYTYEERYQKAQRLIACSGMRQKNLTLTQYSGEPYTVFHGSGRKHDMLYIGLNRAPEEGPVSLFFELMDNQRYSEFEYFFEYSTRQGYRQLQVVDNTEGFTRSGLISFLPPADFAPCKEEESSAFWIRLVSRQAGRTERQLPVICGISLNGILVRNIDERPEETFYLEEPEPDLKLTVSARDIMDVRVLVNERNQLSYQQMVDMQKEMPEKVRMERDFQGQIAAFYVLWEETEDFSKAKDRRVYRLNRQSGEIIFGDGLRTEIPRTTGDAAVIVQARSSRGSAANVAQGSIDRAYTSLLFIDEIHNPIRGYGGCDMEQLDHAMQRGANLFSSRRRLVSISDYLREIYSFSDQVHQARALPGMGAEGPDEGKVALVLLMKDYAQGSYSFHQLKERLRTHLLQQCEMTIPSDCLLLLEPTFVEITVTAWIIPEDPQESFVLQRGILKELENFLDPVREGSIWRIGVMPTESQLRMKLASLRSPVTVHSMVITAAYTDAAGYHEMHLSELQETPYMICTSGRHSIHVENK